MTPHEFIDALCLSRHRWKGRREAIHAANIYYVDVASLGHELTRAVQSGCKHAWVTRAFEVIEVACREGSTETLNLVQVGLFEAIQGDAYHHGPHDLIESKLGPRSLETWADLIEGWTGKGIRTIEHWRRVVRNGPIVRFRFQVGESGISCEVDEERGARLVEWRGETRRERAMTVEETTRYLRPLWPLVSPALLANDTALGEPWGELTVESPREVCRIVLGREIDGGRVARVGERELVVDVTTLIEAWTELESVGMTTR